MKKILRVILLLLLVLAGCRTIAKVFAGQSGDIPHPATCICQKCMIDATDHAPVSPFGEYGQNLLLETLPVSEVPSGNPTPSLLLLKSLSDGTRSVAAYIPHPDKQYDVDTPFYCTQSCEYYIFALRRIII